MKAFTGGIIVAALTLVGLWLRMRRLQKLTAAVKALNGKVVVITGASSGLGEACAHAFYSAGCNLIICARRLNELERVKADLDKCSSSSSDRVKIVNFDLADYTNIDSAIQKVIGCYGRIDIVVNNGGLSYRGSVIDTSIDVDVTVMNVNYFGQVAVTKAILPHLLKQKFGHIVVVGSVQSKLALPFRSAYSASKHAMQSFCDSLRAELCIHRDVDIGVTVVHPAYIQTNLSLNAVTSHGSQYGKMDETQSSGMTADHAASRILNAVALRRNEVLISPFTYKLVTYLRNLMPDLYHREMAKRAVRQSEKQKQS